MLQPLGFAHLQPTVLSLPVVERRIADPVLPAQLSGAQPRFALLQNSNYLLFRKPTLFHCPSPLRLRRFISGKLQLRLAQFEGSTSPERGTQIL